MIQTLGFDRFDKAFRVAIQIWTSGSAMTSCDVEITSSCGQGVIRRTHVEADQLLVKYESVVLNMETATRMY